MATLVDKVNMVLTSSGMRPITRDNLLYYYAPIKGSLSYGVLSVQMFNPELFENFKFLVIPQWPLDSPSSFTQATPKEKFIYCTFGTVMFNLGSMLLWALGRTVAPENTVVRTMMGAAGAVGALYIGKNYVAYLDAHVRTVKA
nr:uncharacterized protein LOC128703287 [Cherax quadricarinatus]